MQEPCELLGMAQPWAQLVPPGDVSPSASSLGQDLSRHQLKTKTNQPTNQRKPTPKSQPKPPAKQPNEEKPQKAPQRNKHTKIPIPNSPPFPPQQNSQCFGELCSRYHRGRKERSESSVWKALSLETGAMGRSSLLWMEMVSGVCVSGMCCCGGAGEGTVSSVSPWHLVWDGDMGTVFCKMLARCSARFCKMLTRPASQCCQGPSEGLVALVLLR